jgi:hypothetical protein
LKFNLKNRPQSKLTPFDVLGTSTSEVEEWFEGFEKELRTLLKAKNLDGTEGIYTVSYVDKRPITVYIDVKKILGE